MLEFIEALRFLTILPLRAPFNESALRKSPRVFPLAGLFIGIVTSISFLIISRISTREIASLITLFVWESITGSIHLDGFADTLDGIMSRRDREGILEIMRDSRIGTFGATGIFFMLGLKYLAISNSGVPVYTLLLSPVIGRFLITLSIYLFPYARITGKGSIFSGGIKREDLLFSLIITIILSLLIGRIRGVLVFAVTVISGLIFAGYLNKRIGGLTGDNYGAICEFAEVISLLLL
ncbi:MAG TPA: adenosylcobinamide-GDP ribazoletransferase [bacterium]|nr:adenosylcobinamide-GDP ribazoletransferase [bacterium]